MATYSTDLTTLTTAEAGTWTEFNSPYTGAGTPAADGENFIQGTDCRSQTTGKAVGLEISIVFDNGSNVTFATDDVVIAWVYYAVGVNLETYANSGWRFGIGSGTGAWDWFRIGGSDYGRNPYGGWMNVAIDPTATESGTIGGGNGGSFRYFGSVPYTLNEISKGTPSAVDAIRYGRGEISVTGSGGSFAELAQYNDYNAGSTPPGTSSTSVDSGRHRLGLFQEAAGTYLWKGLMSLGITATSVTFSDSNETIIIDDCPHTYAAFNKVEINNASSSVTLTNITFISTASTSVALGQFEVIDNATVALTGCSFNDMGSFGFLSNTTVTNSTFNTCGLITTGGATMTGCAFNSLTGAVGVTASSPANAAKISGCTFSSDGTGNGLEITGTAANLTLTDVDFTGYSLTVDANKAIYVNISTGTVNLTISGGSGVTADSHVRTAGATVNVITGAVDVTVKAVDDNGDPIQSATAHLRASNGTGPFPYQAAVTITRATTTATVSHTSHGMASNDKVLLRGISDKTEDDTVHQITVTGTNSYTYTTTDSGSTSYTGTTFLVDGQDETSYDNSPTTEGTFSGGTGHSVSDVIRIDGGSLVTVDAVSTGVVTQFTVNAGPDGGEHTASDTLSQRETTGSGTGFSLTVDTDNLTTIIKSTFVALNGTTDAQGEITVNRVYSSDQPVVGWTRKASSSPYYKQGTIVDTIDNINGLNATSVMVSDE